MITVRAMLSLGRDMGLNTVYESWMQIQSHYDAFFSIENFQEEQRVFNAEMFELGLLERNINPETKGMYRWPDKDETLVDAMARLSYDYVEPDWDEMSQQSFEADVTLEEMDDFFSPCEKNPLMQCKDCGEHMEGDGYSVVVHCPNSEYIRYYDKEPDANPVHCEGYVEEDEDILP